MRVGPLILQLSPLVLTDRRGDTRRRQDDAALSLRSSRLFALSGNPSVRLGRAVSVQASNAVPEDPRVGVKEDPNVIGEGSTQWPREDAR